MRMLHRPYIAALALIAHLLLVAPCADACRYSVREVGYVDLDRGVYHLYIYYNNQVPEDSQGTLRRAAAVRLRDSCIETEFVHVDEAKDHPGLAYLTYISNPTFPCAVLVSPEDRVREVPLAGQDGDIESAIEALVDSPLRRKLLDEIAEAYCVVLFVEGESATANLKARTAVVEAVDAMTRNMGSVEKPTDKPPALVELPRQAQTAEEWLLWSLGLEPAGQTDPGVAVLFGRGRRLGATLRGDRATASELTRIMAFIGASCECGLDRAWMQGVMVPLRWDRPVRERLARHLGFDPDSPLVRMEMSQILAQGAAQGAGLRFDDPFFGYREFSTLTAEESAASEMSETGSEALAATVQDEDAGSGVGDLPSGIWLGQETGQNPSQGSQDLIETAYKPIIGDQSGEETVSGMELRQDTPGAHGVQREGLAIHPFVWIAGAVVLANVLVVLGLVVKSRRNTP